MYDCLWVYGSKVKFSVCSMCVGSFSSLIPILIKPTVICRAGRLQKYYLKCSFMLSVDFRNNNELEHVEVQLSKPAFLVSILSLTIHLTILSVSCKPAVPLLVKVQDYKMVSCLWLYVLLDTPLLYWVWSNSSP